MKGRDWMVRDFSWKRVAQDTADVYAWLVGRAKQPASLRLE
jgi:hypothetical protein